LIIKLMLLKETVNLNRLKGQVGNLLGNHSARPSSHYQRLVRYFAHPFALHVVWKLLLSFAFGYLVPTLDGRRGGRYLVLDATCWELGRRKYHVQVLSIVHHGIAIPLFWTDLKKKGHSNFDERKRLFQMAMRLYDLKGLTLLADREYEGREWFDWLDRQGISFIIRLPFGHYRHDVEEGHIAYSNLIKKAMRGRKTETLVGWEGKRYRLLATKDKRDGNGLLLLLTNRRGKTHKLMDAYRLRWKIESMFLHWKSNGFHLEELNLKQPKKVRLMIALLVTAYTLCVVKGAAKLKEIRKKKSGNLAPYQSLFRKGFEELERFTGNLVLFIENVIYPLMERKIDFDKPK